MGDSITNINSGDYCMKSQTTRNTRELERSLKIKNEIDEINDAFIKSDNSVYDTDPREGFVNLRNKGLEGKANFDTDTKQMNTMTARIGGDNGRIKYSYTAKDINCGNDAGRDTGSTYMKVNLERGGNCETAIFKPSGDILYSKE